MSRPSAQWPSSPPTPDPEPATHVFSSDDIATLARLLREDATKHPAATPPPKRSPAKPTPAPPPNLGYGLAVVLIALIVAACAVAVVLILVH